MAQLLFPYVSIINQVVFLTIGELFFPIVLVELLDPARHVTNESPSTNGSASPRLARQLDAATWRYRLGNRLMSMVRALGGCRRCEVLEGHKVNVFFGFFLGDLG